MAEHGDSARRKAKANIYTPEIYRKIEMTKSIIVYTCSNCGNVLRSKAEIEEKLCKSCKEKK